KYSGEKKGTIDWEIRAKVARKSIDKPIVEMERIEGQYKPQEKGIVFFTGTRGIINTEEEKGAVENVHIMYNEYELATRVMNFNFKEGVTSTSAPVDIKGTKFVLRGLGLIAKTAEQTIHIERDVAGFIETEKGKYRFQSDTFTYLIKDNVYILEGKVIMKNEDMNLLCEKLYLYMKDDNIDKIDAMEKVRLISKGDIAESEKAVYNFNEDKITFTDSPKVYKDNITLEGEPIIYNLTNKKFSVEKPKVRVEK
ncbi:MAG TPA: hypothetical protein DDW17_03335, partial [Deltaproteobacteria bacterium]|nr:hypothetical protein [Deltaproteobacteria bacterium]